MLTAHIVVPSMGIDSQGIYGAPGGDPWVSSAPPSAMDAAGRPTFEIYFDDDRYGVPTLHLLTTEDDDDAARATAERMLGENAHYRGAELWRDGRRLLGLGSLASVSKTGEDG